MMSRMLPPGPRGVPILGMLPAVRRDPTGVFMRAARRFGDVVYFKIGPRRGYLLTNPSDIRHVLQDNARNYHKSPLYQKLRMSIGNGLLTSEDEFWLRQRRIAQPAFHRQRVAELAGVMAKAARETADEWQSKASDGRPVDISEEMMRFTRTVVLRALLGGDLGPFASTIDQAWVVINERVGNSFWSLGIAERFQRAKARQFDAARIVLRQAVEYVINERRRRPTDSADLLSMLMGARDEETGESMTDEQLRVEVTTFLLAGQETTSLALTWTWFLLSQHPSARQRLEHEIDTVLGDRPPEYSDLAQHMEVSGESKRRHSPRAQSRSIPFPVCRHARGDREQERCGHQGAHPVFDAGQSRGIHRRADSGCGRNDVRCTELSARGVRRDSRAWRTLHRG